MDNYYIKEKGKENYFAGWDRFGEITFKPDPKYVYRMKRTVAIRNLCKTENYLNSPCEVCKLA